MTRRFDSIVEPEAPFPRSAQHDAELILRSGGWPAADAAWIAKWLLATLPTCGTTDHLLSQRTEGHLTILATSWGLAIMEAPGPLSSELARNRAALMLLAILSNGLRTPEIIVDDDWNTFSTSEDQSKQFVQLAQKHGVDFDAAVRSGWPSFLRSSWGNEGRMGTCERASRFMRLLLATGAIDLVEVLDLDRLREGRYCSGFSLGSDPDGGAWLDGTDWFAPTVFEVWVRHAGACVLPLLVPAVRDEPDSTAATLAETLARAAASRFANSEYGLTIEYYGSFTPFWKEHLQGFARAMRPYFETLDERIGNDPRKASQEWRSAWMLLFRMAWDVERTSCPADLRRRLIGVASSQLHRVRSQLTWSNAEEASERAAAFEKQLPHLKQCCSLVAFHASCWEMMNPLLQALRKLQTPAVARDLRDWAEFDHDPVPEPWVAIPALLKTYFHAAVTAEQANDTDLDELRGQFARFCLERLKSKKANKRDRGDSTAPEAIESARTSQPESVGVQLNEPSPIWRYCMIRALQELRSNPGGTGHHVLHWSAGHDPDERIRKAAASCEQWLRHQRTLPERLSPRRIVLLAFWWLKQAHALELGVSIDPAGAQRTRRKENERAKALEQAGDPRIDDGDPTTDEHDPEAGTSPDGGAA